ncbi:SDR family oxidoreductase [Actinocrinis sp.]|uniref:SDR family oxidoreductase n=1 Tax=Actinocrinis sp. TaxID=1920516 RepID=UPI002D5D05CC|nr:SDR family oxidoreductase [Actinocrinis sp.]HZP53604.1 SDR family oxidoreductase [Actinocrinis sp.]
MSENNGASGPSQGSHSQLPAVQLAGAGVIVTGAARGIGAALARAFAAEGARVVVNDVDADGARALAEELGAFAVLGDAATETGVSLLVGSARELLGSIDVYCANAGIGPAGTEQAPEDVWSAAWEINVMAHVRAARELVPGWLERGSGCFVSTVSAAGLLTMLGSAPYAASKHAALAFAEWLAATYRHRGVRVHAVCPQGVRTRMLDESGPGGQALLAAGAIEPEQVAQAVIRGLSEDKFLILPHPDVAEYYAARAADPDRWLGGMNKLQRGIEAQLGR